MKKYLVRWNDGDTHAAILDVYGIRRLHRRIYHDKVKMQVCVWELAENSIYVQPNPVRIFYDWKFDKLSLFALNGSLVEKTEVNSEVA